MNAVKTALQKQLYGIGIFEEEIVLSDFTGDAEKRFVVQPDQLMAFFRSEITFRPFPGLIWMKSDGTADTYLMLLPKGERTILYRQKKQIIDIRLHLPAIAVEAKFDGERKITSIRIWGFPGRILTPESVLYELPLPNLTKSSLCLGATERAFCSDVRQAVEKVIFDTPFNHHNHLVGTGKLPFHDYVKKYAGKCPFRTLNKIGFGREILGGLK